MPFFHFKTCHNDANMLYFSHRKQGVFAMAGYRRERVNEEVGRIVNETIMTIKDPRVSPHIITITHCDVSGDLKFAKIYFSILLFMGGIIGMSLVNSIFVDAMAADNNDEVLEKLSQLEEKLDKIQSEQKENR